MEYDESETPETASVGPAVTDDERRWTKGRRHSLPTPEQRVLSQFSEAELREMLDLPPQPPISVAQRESETDVSTAEPAAPADPAPAADPPPDFGGAYDPTPGFEPAGEPPAAPSTAAPPTPPAAVSPAPPADPKSLVNVAVNPQTPSTQIVGFPGTRLVAPLLAGDIILRGKHRRRAKMVTRPGTHRANTVKRRGGRPREGGFYAEVIGEDGYERIAGPDGLLLDDVLIVRSRSESDFGESDPPIVPRPTVRQGSRGPAVTEAQTRLNTVHATRVTGGERGLDRCPLTVDGVFGANTRAATVAFQRTAFPNQPGEWDGVIGPRTWTALIAASGSGGRQTPLPTRCPGLPLEQQIDNFDFGSADILPRHQPQIIGIARCIMESQSSATPVRHLRLIGHTDSVGSPADNVALGLRRAEAVRREVLSAIARMTGRPAPATLVIDVDSRGETEPQASDAQSRRVQVFSDFVFPAVVPPRPRPRPAAAATIEFVLDDDGDHRVDGSAPVATALMFGLWDNAYGPGRAVRNDPAEANNFVGSDRRRFYLRVTDRGATGSTVTARWRTLTAGGADDDAPASQNVTLTETAAGSKIFVSRALMLVSDDTDANQPTDSGLTAGPDTGVRNRGQSNHRLRRAALDGSVRADYTAAAGGAVSVTLPVFRRNPESRRRVTLRVVHLGLTMTPARRTLIDQQFLHANRRWAQTGLRIDKGPTSDLALPAGATNANGDYTGDLDTPAERLVLDLLVPNTPDDTITVCFCTIPRDASGDPTFNAYAGINQTQGAVRLLGNRFFIFQHVDLNADFETLAHELHHVLFNREDSPQDLRFFTFNTFAPGGALPNVSTYRRIQTLFTADPDNDPNNENTFNWMRRRRTGRLPMVRDPVAINPASATTGNTSVGTF
ncbi:OmpA family protein [Sphingomonas psychrotolerans]|uniref:OmpA family protein n=1 Tax=Sphingomonas psychrotolerans TaxID=1327635 RepID=UPI001305193A|nr:OmpA family protein [Sphingomonas psychrotolerans]